MVIDHTMLMQHRQNPSKLCTVVLTTGQLPVLRICQLLASAVAAKFKQLTVSLLQLHDRHKRKQPLCVFSHYSPHENVVFPFLQRFLTSPPVISIAILNVMADSHKQTSDPASIDSLRMSHRSRISQPRFNGFTGSLGAINRKLYGVFLSDNSITTQPVLTLKTQSRR